MGLFRFPHSWAAIAGRAQALTPSVPELDDRDRALEDYLAATSFTVFDFTNALSGTAPTAPAGGFLIQCGTNVGAGASPTTVTFDTPFPNGVISVVACFGDSPGVSTFYTTNVATTGFDFVSGAAVGHRINWIAIGW